MKTDISGLIIGTVQDFVYKQTAQRIHIIKEDLEQTMENSTFRSFPH